MFTVLLKIVKVLHNCDIGLHVRTRFRLHGFTVEFIVTTISFPFIFLKLEAW